MGLSCYLCLTTAVRTPIDVKGQKSSSPTECTKQREVFVICMSWGAVTAASLASSGQINNLQGEAECGWSSVLAKDTSLAEAGRESVSSSNQGVTSAAVKRPSLAEESDDYEDLVVAQFAPFTRKGRPPEILSELMVHEPSGAIGAPLAAANPDNIVGDSVLASGSGATPRINVKSLVVPSLASTCLVSQNGHPPMPLASQALELCVKLAEQNGGENLDDDIMKLHKMFVASGTSFHHASKVLQAESMNMSRFSIQSKLLRLASAHFVFARVQRLRLEEHICQRIPKVDLLLVIDYMSYDETPMKASVLVEAASSDLQSASQDTLQSTSMAIPGVKASMSMTVNTTAPNCKILQVKHQYCMLFKVAGLGFVKFMGDSQCHLSVLQKTNAKVLKQALANVSSTSVFNDEFQLKTRLASVDQHGANLLCEQSIPTDRQPGWMSMVLPCDIHSTARAFSKTCDGLHPCSTCLEVQHGNIQVLLERGSVQEVADQIWFSTRKGQSLQGTLHDELHDSGLQVVAISYDSQSASKW
eukprot:5796253-Amphidinium_carterae.2